jgi:hypothetical protein
MELILQNLTLYVITILYEISLLYRFLQSLFTLMSPSIHLKTFLSYFNNFVPLKEYQIINLPGELSHLGPVSVADKVKK